MQVSNRAGLRRREEAAAFCKGPSLHMFLPFTSATKLHVVQNESEEEVSEEISEEEVP
jgi:hypothetical protein